MKFDDAASDRIATMATDLNMAVDHMIDDLRVDGATDAEVCAAVIMALATKSGEAQLNAKELGFETSLVEHLVMSGFSAADEGWVEKRTRGMVS